MIFRDVARYDDPMEEEPDAFQELLRQAEERAAQAEAAEASQQRRSPPVELTEEQRERMRRNRELAAERRRLRMAQAAAAAGGEFGQLSQDGGERPEASRVDSRLANGQGMEEAAEERIGQSVDRIQMKEQSGDAEERNEELEWPNPLEAGGSTLKQDDGGREELVSLDQMMAEMEED